MSAVDAGAGHHHILSVLVENRPGVLARVASLFARRGYNIFSLAVAPTEDERFSRLTIVVDLDSAPLEQITKQLFKLIAVVKSRYFSQIGRPGMVKGIWDEASTRYTIIDDGAGMAAR